MSTFSPPTFPPTTAHNVTTVANVTNTTTAPYRILIDDRSDVMKMSENELVGLIAGIGGFILLCISVAVFILYCRSKQGSDTFGNSCIGRWCCCCRCLWESQVHTASSFYRRRHRTQPRSEGAGDELYGPRDIEVEVTYPQPNSTYEEELVWMPSHHDRQSRKRPPSTERYSPQESPSLAPAEPYVLTHNFSQEGTVEDDISSTSNPVQSVNSLNADECQRGAVLPHVHTDPSALVGRVVAQSGPTDHIALWADDQLKHMGTHEE